MNKFNKAFTLSELLVSILIIGIIMAISVKTIKMLKSSYTPLAYYSYNTVKDLTNILMATNIAKNRKSGVTTIQGTTVECIDTSGQIVQVLRPDGYNSTPTSPPLCTNLPAGTSNSIVCNTIVKDIVNTVKAADTCTNLYSVSLKDGVPEITNINNSSVYNNPTFTTTNGQRYYMTYNYKPANNDVFKFGFRLLAVDLNGKKEPNSAKAQGKTPPDIITFMIMDNGDIYPLGVAADNIKLDEYTFSYITANVKGYCYPRPDEEYVNSEGKTVTKPFSQWHCPVTEEAYVPPNCRVKHDDGTGIAKDRCSFVVERPITPKTYRQAYCAVRSNIYAVVNAAGELEVNDDITYVGYCPSNEILNDAFRGVCSPYVRKSDKKSFDRCDLELVKPIFRFNFR